MKCKTAKVWLLQERMRVTDWPRPLNRHVKKCASCATIARQLFKLEEAWRNISLPPQCEQGKATFLKSLPKPAPGPTRKRTRVSLPVAVPGRSNRRTLWATLPWAGALAAMVLISISIFAWLLVGTSQARADNTDVVDRLIAWNIEITKSDHATRRQLVKEYEAQFRAELAKGGLPADEMELGSDLIENGVYLASHEDDDEEVERITVIAAKLYARTPAAGTQSDDPKEGERCEARFAAFWQRGVLPIQEKIGIRWPEPKKGGFEKDKGGFDKGKAGIGKGIFGKGPFDKGGFDAMKRQFDKMMERPEFSRPDGHKRFDGHDFKGPGGFGPGGFGPGGKKGKR